MNKAKGMFIEVSSSLMIIVAPDTVDLLCLDKKENESS